MVPKKDRNRRTELAPQSEASHQLDELKLDDYLPYQFSVLSGYLSQALMSQYGEPFNLTIPEWRVVAFLGNKVGLSAGEISESTRLDEVAIHRAVKCLLKKGLLTRTVANDDKRRKPLALTKQGQRVFLAITPLALELERDMLNCLSSREATALRKIMTKLQKDFLSS